MRVPRLGFLPVPLWEIWRDLTWAREARSQWLAKMQRYYDAGSRAKEMAEARVRAVAWGDSVWDWDDNVPSKWALHLAKKWGLKK